MKASQERKEFNISITSTKFVANFLTETYYAIKMNKKFLIFINWQQSNELYIYKLDNYSVFSFIKLKEPINYFDFHNNYETIFSVSIGNDILIYNIDIEKNMINEISKIKGHFSKVIFTEFSPFDPNILLTVYKNNDIKIFALNSTMPKNHIFFDEPFVEEKIKWTKNHIGVLSKDEKKILISPWKNFNKEKVREKLFKEEITDFHFYDDNNEEYLIVLTKKDVIFVEKEKEGKSIYQIKDNVYFYYSFYFKSKKILIIFVEKMLIGLILNFDNIKQIFEIKIDSNLYPLFFYNEKSLENNEICKFFYLRTKKINLFSVNLTGYGIKEINNKNNSNEQLITGFLKSIVKNISDIGYLISKILKKMINIFIIKFILGMMKLKQN